MDNTKYGVPRMLGTALVLACLQARELMHRGELRKLIGRASKAPWICPPGRYTARLLEYISARSGQRDKRVQRVGCDGEDIVRN